MNSISCLSASINRNPLTLMTFISHNPSLSLSLPQQFSASLVQFVQHASKFYIIHICSVFANQILLKIQFLSPSHFISAPCSKHRRQSHPRQKRRKQKLKCHLICLVLFKIHIESTSVTLINTLFLL